MRTTLLVFFCLLVTSHQSIAQSACQTTYLGFGGGINSPTGMIGVTIEHAVGKQLTLDAGFGLSGWGYRATVGGKYFLQECYRGLAFGMAWSRSTGIEEIELDMEVVTGETESVTLEYLPQDNIQISTYLYWPLKDRGRFHLQVGYSANVSPKNYNVLSNHSLSKFSEDVMRLATPGGIIVAAGFSFGLTSAP